MVIFFLHLLNFVQQLIPLQPHPIIQNLTEPSSYLVFFYKFIDHPQISRYRYHSHSYCYALLPFLYWNKLVIFFQVVMIGTQLVNLIVQIQLVLPVNFSSFIKQDVFLQIYQFVVPLSLVFSFLSYYSFNLTFSLYLNHQLFQIFHINFLQVIMITILLN